MKFISHPNYKPKSIVEIDENNYPKYLDGNNYVYIDERICSIPKLMMALSKSGYNLYTVYKLMAIVDKEIAMIAHPTMDSLNENLCIGIPLAYIRPRDIGPRNNFHYLTISTFCPWCNQNHMKVMRSGVKCHDEKHEFIFKIKKRMLCATLKVPGYLDIYSEVRGTKSQTLTKIQDAGIINTYECEKKFVEEADRYHKLIFFRS